MSFPVSASIFNGFPNFVNISKQYPVLSAEEEREHAHLFFHLNDQESYKTLILSHLRFVGSIVKNCSGYGMPAMDLAQEGVVGLIKAVKKFDPRVGVRLATFAVHWIKAEINEFVLRNYSMVKIATTKPQRKLFFNMSKIKTATGNSLSDNETQMVADELNITADEVRKMERRLNAPETSLDLPASDDDGQQKTLLDSIPDNNSNLEQQVEEEQVESRNIQSLTDGIKMLDDRSQIIVNKRWLSEDKATLHDLAVDLSISAERVRQLEANALKKLKNIVQYI